MICIQPGCHNPVEDGGFTCADHTSKIVPVCGYSGCFLRVAKNGDWCEKHQREENFKVRLQPGPTILEEAAKLTSGERNKDYGHPLDDFARTAAIWSAILGVTVTPQQVALCMVGVKISRECNAPKRDNLVDGAGYFRTLEMVLDEQAKRKGPKC